MPQETGINYEVEFDYSINSDDLAEEFVEEGAEAEDAGVEVYSDSANFTLQNSQGLVADAARIEEHLRKLGYESVVLTKVERTGETTLL